MPSLSEFARRMSILGRRVEENSDALVRKVSVAINTTVVLATPVDTGRARSNWQIGIGSAPMGTKASFGPNSAGNVISFNNAKIQAYTSANKGQYVYITNNLPYIKRLNNGHSAQAPVGYVERAIVVGTNSVRGARLLDINIGGN